MVIVRIIGGLGNQMFQYAAGRRLAHVLGAEFKLDISSYEKFYKLRTYNLSVFNIQESIAATNEVQRLTLKNRSLLKRISNRLLRKQQTPPATYCKEKYFHFDPDILNLFDDVYLEGYWQSEKYFADISEIIRQAFSVKIPQRAEDQELGELIGSCESVSLHIRRGDYVADPRIRQMFVPCGLDYYYRCVDHISQTLRRPHFFIFSDDHQWACANLKLPFPTVFVDHNGTYRDYEDLRLMSLCKHNIIANSSFSWWGAWLNNYKEKIVIAPSKWFRIDMNESDLIPENWLRL